MKRKISILITGIMLLSAIYTIAEGVYGRITCAMPVTTGAATWTNTADYAALELKRIGIEGGLLAGDTVTVARISVISSTESYTNTIMTAVLSSGKSSQVMTNFYLNDNDKLSFASGTGTGATAVIEYELQRR